VPTKKLKRSVAAAPPSQPKQKMQATVSKPKPSRAASRGKTAVKVSSKNTRTATAVADQNTSFGMKEVKELISLIKDSGNFNTFAYKTDAFEIEINVGNGSIPAIAAAPQGQLADRAAPIPMPVVSPAPTLEVNRPSNAGLALEPNQRLITSPMVGTFFRRPNPSLPPFVEVGDDVQVDTALCIVEVMKLLNTIEAGCNGRVVSILVDDGASIESGQPLMILELK
jgi:acetyl-CoA carboxylase biotin carboxyl carrier protein